MALDDGLFMEFTQEQIKLFEMRLSQSVIYNPEYVRNKVSYVNNLLKGYVDGDVKRQELYTQLRVNARDFIRYKRDINEKGKEGF